MQFHNERKGNDEGKLKRSKEINYDKIKKSYKYNKYRNRNIENKIITVIIIICLDKIIL
mgnify:CR=1 FL=1